MLRPGRKPHRTELPPALVQLFRCLWSRHFAYTFNARLRTDMTPYLLHYFLSLLLFMRIITSIFQSFCALPERHATRHTRGSHKELLYWRFWTFQFGLHHNLQPPIFQSLDSLEELGCRAMLFSPTTAPPHVSDPDGMIVTEFKRSLKYSTCSSAKIVLIVE